MIKNCPPRPAAMPPSTTQILYEGIGMLIPMWLFKVATTHLPTKLFKMVRRANQIAFQIGRNVVREKKKGMEIGLDVDTDVIGALRKHDTAAFSLHSDSRWQQFNPIKPRKLLVRMKSWPKYLSYLVLDKIQRYVRTHL